MTSLIKRNTIIDGHKSPSYVPSTMAKRGRPPSPVGTTKMATLNVRLLHEEKEQLRKAASEAGDWNLSEWARKTLMAAVSARMDGEVSDGYGGA